MIKSLAWSLLGSFQNGNIKSNFSISKWSTVPLLVLSIRKRCRRPLRMAIRSSPEIQSRNTRSSVLYVVELKKNHCTVPLNIVFTPKLDQVARICFQFFALNFFVQCGVQFPYSQQMACHKLQLCGN